MHRIQRSAALGAVAALCSFLLAGCGGADAPMPLNQAELKNIHDMYWHHLKRYEKAPAELADLARTEYEGIYPTTVKALRDGKYVVVWNLKDKQSQAILAYEKDVPTQGGAVILADGAVKSMTAAEFQAAQKS